MYNNIENLFKPTTTDIPYEQPDRLVISLILRMDSYKFSHPFAYPDGIKAMVSYGVARVPGNQIIIPFGMQILVKKYLTESITLDDIDEAEQFSELHFGKKLLHRAAFEKVVNAYNGKLPLIIRAVPEGTKMKGGLPLYTVSCFDADLYWMSAAFETLIQRGIWYPTTIATNDYIIKQDIKRYYDQSGANMDMLPFSYHCFGQRGTTCGEQAEIGGCAHTVNFMGSDTVEGIVASNFYYKNKMSAYSVYATEHSVQCSFGPSRENAIEYIRHQLKKVKELGLPVVSIVLDGYDIYREVELCCTVLKQDIIDCGAKVTFRPDCYSDDTKILTPHGWKYFKDLDESDRVAQVENDGSYTFVRPHRIIAQQYSGKMHQFNDHHGKIDLLVTPNHRMILQQNGKERVVVAEKLAGSGHHKQTMQRAARAQSNGKSLTAMERLNIAFQADGSYCSKMTSSIRFSFSKQRKIDRMKMLLDDANLAYKIYSLKDSRSEFNIKVDSSLFSKNFEWVDVAKLDGNWCEEFIEELSHWDSCIRSDDRIKFDNTNKSVIDVVELIAISAGYGTLVSTYHDIRKDNFSDCHTVNILKDNRLGGQSWKHTMIDYDGMVYCVQVPSGKLLVKRNRGAVVCGNSGDMMEVVPRILEMQEMAFGVNITSTGHKQIKYVGCIQGDGVDHLAIRSLLGKITSAFNYSADCVIFGSGGALLQKVNRDTYKFAQKACAILTDNGWVGIAKNPVTDSGKKSAEGVVTTVKSNMTGELMSARLDNGPLNSEFSDIMQLVYHTGILYNETTLDIVRNTVDS